MLKEDLVAATEFTVSEQLFVSFDVNPMGTCPGSRQWGRAKFPGDYGK